MSDNNIRPHDLGIDVDEYLKITKECTEEQNRDRPDPHTKKSHKKSSTATQAASPQSGNLLKKPWFITACAFLGINILLLGFTSLNSTEVMDASAAMKERSKTFSQNYESIVVTDNLLDAAGQATSADDPAFNRALEEYEEIMSVDSIDDGMEAEDFHFLGNTTVVYQSK